MISGRALAPYPTTSAKLRVPPAKIIPILRNFFPAKVVPALKSLSIEGIKFNIVIPRRSPIIGAPTQCCSFPSFVAITAKIKHVIIPIYFLFKIILSL